jgi:hypothetical protein
MLCSRRLLRSQCGGIWLRCTCTQWTAAAVVKAGERTTLRVCCVLLLYALMLAMSTERIFSVNAVLDVALWHGLDVHHEE